MVALFLFEELHQRASERNDGRLCPQRSAGDNVWINGLIVPSKVSARVTNCKSIITFITNVYVLLKYVPENEKPNPFAISGEFGVPLTRAEAANNNFLEWLQNQLSDLTGRQVAASELTNVISKEAKKIRQRGTTIKDNI